MKSSEENHTTQSVPLETVQESLYAKREKIYPRETKGLFSNLRMTSVFVLLGIYYIFPWLTWDGRQAVLLDLPARKFYIFGLTFWPQDMIFLAFLLIMAGLTLFFFTALAGRLWCGFACPQTVWTEVFLWMERWVEGDRPQQMKLDKAPMSAHKFRIKATKHAIWIFFAAYTGLTFVGFFSPIRGLCIDLIHFNASTTETFWVFFYGFATYGNAGWLREQICIYMCPYARFQSAMFDKDTMVLAYDAKRGEPHGSRKRGEDYKAAGLGDCVNCTMCVQVCPTGIDIRDGLQYQCISCSACIDVCDEVMVKVGYPKGLIRYTTQNILDGGHTHVFRLRIFIYGFLLLSLFLGWMYAISQRSLVELDVMRDRNSLFKETETGFIENVYVVKLMNLDEHAHSFKISAQGIEGLQLEVNQTSELKLASGEILDVPVRLIADPKKLKQRSTDISFQIQASDAPTNPKLTTVEQARFLGPITR
ncbi:MAG: cytochrome c oxidase accessory protein CcoG [Pseudomonadota bacterium]|jgi:cytochrome c oxidase accessory protein FixG